MTRAVPLGDSAVPHFPSCNTGLVIVRVYDCCDAWVNTHECWKQCLAQRSSRLMTAVIKGCYFFPPSSSIRKAFCRRGSQGSQRWETIWNGGKEPHGIRIWPVCLTLRPELTSSSHRQHWLEICSHVSTESICDHWNLLETQNQTHTYGLDCLLTRPPGDHVPSDLWVPSRTRIHCPVRQWLP